MQRFEFSNPGPETVFILDRINSDIQHIYQALHTRADPCRWLGRADPGRWLGRAAQAQQLRQWRRARSPGAAPSLTRSLRAAPSLSPASEMVYAAVLRPLALADSALSDWPGNGRASPTEEPEPLAEAPSQFAGLPG